MVRCPRCSYEWEPRKKNPKECPRCKVRLDWAGAPEPKTERRLLMKGWKVGLSAVVILAMLATAWLYWPTAPKSRAEAGTVLVPKSVVLGAAPTGSGIENIYIVKATHAAGWNIDFGLGNENILGVITSSGGSANIPYETPFVIVVAVKGTKDNMAYLVKENLMVELAASGSFTIAQENSPDSREYVFATDGSTYIRVNAIWDNAGSGYKLPAGGSVTLNPVRLWCWG
jgi:hypothetical protein